MPRVFGWRLGAFPGRLAECPARALARACRVGRLGQRRGPCSREPAALQPPPALTPPVAGGRQAVAPGWQFAGSLL